VKSRHKTTCPYCGVGCGVVVEQTAEKVTVKGDKSHPANYGRLCSKGAALADTLGLDGRLLHPQIGGVRASWDEALELVAKRFADTAAEYGPDSVAFYVSGQLLTEDYYVANKLMKGFMGSANIDTNSRLCMASAVAAYKRAFGADFVPNSYRDIDHADLLVIVGSNIAWCHPVLFQRARQAKEDNPNMRVVVIDPRRTASCDIADLHLALKPGSDVMLFNGLLAHLHAGNVLDCSYVETHTEGFDRALEVAQESAASIEKVAAACELSTEAVALFYDWFAATPRAVTLFSQGVNQSASGTDKANSIINVHLATGRIGRPGAGPFSLTGQPNAMGGREVGGLANTLAAHMDFTPEDIDRVARFWNAARIATAPGLRAVDLFDEIDAGKVRAVWIMSTNPVVSMPNADRVKAALQKCEFVVVSDCVQATDTTACADVLLPAATWGEKSGTVTNSERRISRQRAFLTPPGEAKPDWWIVCEVAKRLGHVAEFDYSGPAEIFREHARLSAFENDGKRDFDIGGLANFDDAAYDAMKPIRWPAPAASDAAVVPLADARFFTPAGKASFVPTSPQPTVCHVDERYPYLLLTGRVRDQWHTMTRTGKSARLSQTEVEPFVEVHPADAEQLGVVDQGLARITSDLGSVQMRVRVTDTVRRGELFAPMHWSDQFASLARVGALIAPAVDSVSGQPELKATPVAISPVRPQWYGFVLSVEPLAIEIATYVACARGNGYWRYELAGYASQSHWTEAARELLGREGEWVEFADRAAGRYRGARLEGGRLTACLFAASGNSLPERTWLGELFATQTLSDAQRMSLLAARPPESAASAGPIVCACFSVGRDTLIEAIRTQHLTTAKEIGAVLSAGTNCGSCIPELNGLIESCATQPRAVALS